VATGGERQQQPLDLVVVNGSVVDGSGKARYRADVGIVGDSIVEIGDLAGHPAGQVADATGLIVAPGFIDPLHNADMAVVLSPGVDMAISQGVTTAVVGCCGMSMAPASPKFREQARQHAFFKTGYHEAPWDWLSVGDYLQKVDGASAVNVATLIGFDNLWFAVRGFDASPPSDRDIAEMRELAAESMEHGAIGMSHGAGAASLWSTHEQVVEVAKGLTARDGVYACHQRTIVNDDPFAWVREGIGVGTEAGIPVHFVHFKSTTPRTHGREREMLEVVDESRARGDRVTLSSYPYTSGGGGFRVPAWAEEGGPEETVKRLKDLVTRRRIAKEIDDMWTWETYITAVRSDKNKGMDGRVLQEVAQENGTTVGEIVCRLVEDDYGAQHVHQHGGDEGIETILVHDQHMACSDAIYAGNRPHPRCFGAYARYLGRHVREHKALPLEECIRQMTSSPARMIGLPDRGELRPGAKADLVVFDEATVTDRSTWQDPKHEPVGIEYVVVNGAIVREKGKFTGATPGRALRRAAVGEG
jgi:N-acyl-D-amino-acid deacylase